MPNSPGRFVCVKCNATQNGRTPILKLCIACFAEEKGVAPYCGKCKKPLSRKRIAGLATQRNRVLYCSRKCMHETNVGEKHGSWIGGKIIDVGGYVKVRKGGKYTQEHRVVMEEHIGRSLFAWETVHHKDGNRLNNNISNLELMGTRHPKGQFYADWIECLSSQILLANPRCIVSSVVYDELAPTQLLVTNVDSGAEFTLPLV
jgi:hypothetical protein